MGGTTGRIGKPRRRSVTVAAVLAVATLQLCGAAPASAGYPSDGCSGYAGVNSGFTYFNGYVGNTFVRLLSDRPDASTIRYCIAIDTGSSHFGGQVVVNTSAAGAVTADDAWTQCDADPASRVFGETGAVGPVPFSVVVNRFPSGDVWLCVMANDTTVAKRIRINTSGLPGVTFLPDDPAPNVYSREQPPPGTPSGTCQAATTGKTRILDYDLLASHHALYTWAESSSRAHVCMRFGITSGRLTLDANGGQTLVTTDQSSDFTPCDTNVLTLSDPPIVMRSHVAAPAWVCVRVGAMAQRIKLDTTGGQGIVTFTPDP